MRIKAKPFDLSAARLLDGPFRDTMLRGKAYLPGLDPDRLDLATALYSIPFYLKHPGG